MRSAAGGDIEIDLADLETPLIALFDEQIFIATGQRHIDLLIRISRHDHIAVRASLGSTDLDNAVESAMLDPVHSADRQTDAGNELLDALMA